MAFHGVVRISKTETSKGKAEGNISLQMYFALVWLIHISF